MPDTPSSRPTSPAAVLFAAALAAGALFFYLGDIGKWREDFVWTLRDPATGRADWAELLHLPFFWRPCSLIYVRAIDTLFWSFDPPRHALAVAAHLLAAWCLLRLLRCLSIGPGLAAAGALAFMVQPQAYEVVFWPSATPTSFATALFLIVCRRIVRAAREPAAARLWPTVALAALIPCWNEQPAPALAALPLLYLAAADPAAPLRTRLSRAAAITSACCAVCGVYLALYLATGTHGGRGAIGSYAPIAETPGRAVAAVQRALDLGLGRSAAQTVRGAAITAAGPLRTARGLLWLAATCIAALLWIQAAARNPPAVARDDPPAPRPWLLALFGVIAAAAMFSPIAVLRAVAVEPRMLYPPACCLILSAAAILASARPLARLSRGARLVGAAAFAACAIAAGVCLLGYQTMLKRRAAMDWAEARALQQLVPNPPPDSLLLAVRIGSTAAGTGQWGFDRTEFGAWSKAAYGASLLREVYGRRDLYCDRFRSDTAAGFRFGPDGVRANVWARPGYIMGVFEQRFFPLDHLVPFDIAADGRVSLVRTLWVESPDGQDFRLDLPTEPNAESIQPQASRAIGAPDVPSPFTWRWDTSGRPAVFAPQTLWLVTHPAAALLRQSARSSMTAELPASSSARSLLFRATVTELAAASVRGPDPTLTWRMEPDGPVLAAPTFPLSAIRCQGRWVPFLIDIPPLQHAAKLSLSVEGPALVDIWVTPGAIHDSPTASPHPSASSPPGLAPPPGSPPADPR